MTPFTIAMILGGASLLSSVGGAVADRLSPAGQLQAGSLKRVKNLIDEGRIDEIGRSRAAEMTELGKGSEVIAAGQREGLANLKQAMAADPTGASGVRESGLANILGMSQQQLQEFFGGVKQRSGDLAQAVYRTAMGLESPLPAAIAKAIPDALTTGITAGAGLAGEQAKAGALAASGQETAAGAKAMYDPTSSAWQWRSKKEA